MSNLQYLLAVLLASASLPAMANTLAGTTSGTTLSNPLYAGQSFIISLGGEPGGVSDASLQSFSREAVASVASGSFANITFNFYSAANPQAAYAAGTGYLFTQAYTGTPGQLSSSTAGLLGTASSNGSLYTFAPSLTLTAGVQYFFYEDTLLQPLSGNSTNTAGESFAASSFCSPFTGPYPTLNFQVGGDPAPLTVTPEPSTFALLGTGILAMACVFRKRFA